MCRCVFICMYIIYLHILNNGSFNFNHLYHWAFPEVSFPVFVILKHSPFKIKGNLLITVFLGLEFPPAESGGWGATCGLGAPGKLRRHMFLTSTAWLNLYMCNSCLLSYCTPLWQKLFTSPSPQKMEIWDRRGLCLSQGLLWINLSSASQIELELSSGIFS